VEVLFGAVAVRAVLTGEGAVGWVSPQPVIGETTVVVVSDLDVVEDSIHDYVQSALVTGADHLLQHRELFDRIAWVGGVPMLDGVVQVGQIAPVESAAHPRGPGHELDCGKAEVPNAVQLVDDRVQGRAVAAVLPGEVLQEQLVDDKVRRRQPAGQRAHDVVLRSAAAHDDP